MLNPDVMIVLAASRTADRLREAANDDLAAQVPSEPHGVRLALAAQLHAFADWLAPAASRDGCLTKQVQLRYVSRRAI
jgi:hypothetical protein